MPAELQRGSLQDRAIARSADGLYDAAACLSALMMIGVLVMVLVGILGRQFNPASPAPMPMPAT